ncbi:MAG: hypothetical protein U1E51_25145 [Candidatus Binatia bacterium]|nr:hypothetical protein [Candidatus Binatia bacterium]
MSSIVERARRFLIRRKTAYEHTFAPENQMSRIVLADLAKYCRANKSTAHVNPHVASKLDGRREVWLRIQEHTHLSADELYRLYGGVQENAPD